MDPNIPYVFLGRKTYEAYPSPFPCSVTVRVVIRLGIMGIKVIPGKALKMVPCPSVWFDILHSEPDSFWKY